MATISASRGIAGTAMVGPGARPHTERGGRLHSRPVGASRSAPLSRTERAILIVLAGILVLCALASRHPTPTAAPTTHVRVEQGDTLWAIASRNAPDGLSTAQTADLIAELNGLSSPLLVAGRELDVPTQPGSQNGRLASR